ncbi:MAG: hypothetical protein U1E22_07965 [Coriobacteriia bacterium]|nr:hypothetical protein [Coriobacteriia bacterium]
MTDPTVRFCPHCGAIGARRLGHCKVCKLAVCERCGNIQHVQGETEIVHNECLKNSGGSFSMIKFVK